jgi:predicted nucleotidyltransferase
VREGMRREIFDRMKNMSQRLKDKYYAQTVILFGSYARGEEIEKRMKLGDQFIMDILENGVRL